mgnify:CR=1 FL=1
MRFHHHYPICLFLSIVLISFTGCKKKDMSLKLNEPRNICLLYTSDAADD